MIYRLKLKGLQVLIKDAEDESTIANTKISSYDSDANMIRIPSDKVVFHENKLVKILAHVNDGIYQYFGRMRRTVVANEIEIALFGGQLKNNRKYKRSTINTSGFIEGIIFNKNTVFLRCPIPLTTVNISRGGIRISAMEGSLERGTIFLASLNVPGKQFCHAYRVVSIQSNSLYSEEYGCELYSGK